MVGSVHRYGRNRPRKEFFVIGYKRGGVVLLVLLLLFLSMAAMDYIRDMVHPVNAANVNLTIDGTAAVFTNSPYDNSGVVMAPVQELSTKLGITLTSTANGYFGGYGRSSIVMTKGSNTVYYDGAPIELAAPVTTTGGVDFAPLAFFDYLYGIAVSGTAITHVPTEMNVFSDEDNYQNQINSYGGPDILLQPSAVGSNHGSVYFTPNADCANTEITVSGMSFTNAIRNQSFSKQLSSLYKCQVQYKLSGTTSDVKITAGDLLVIEFWGRATATEDKYGNAYVQLGIEKNGGGGGTATYNVATQLTGDWQRFYVALDTTGISAGTLVGADRLVFNTAWGNQTIEIGDVKLINLGTSKTYAGIERHFYRGQADGAVWRRAAQERIEKYRKSDLNIKVVDQNGLPVQSANVQVNMKSDKFTIGTSIYNQTFYSSATYRSNLPSFIELIEPENDFKWKEWDQNSCTSVAGDGTWLYNYAMANGYKIRGHNLIWDSASHYPSYADYNLASGCTKTTALDWSTITQANATSIINSHIQHIVSAYPNLTEWDVINEGTASEQSLLRGRFGDTFFAQFLNTAKAANPNAKSFVNEYSMVGGYNPTIQKMIDQLTVYKNAGAKVDGFGNQAHVRGNLYIQDIYNETDAIAQYVDEVGFTEYDIKLNDEALAANYLSDMLIMAYSMPKATEFILWDIKDDPGDTTYHILRQDYSKTPSYYSMESVINSWATNTSGTTDSTGFYQTRGTNGTYEITAISGSATKTVTYDTASAQNEIVITLPSNTPDPLCTPTSGATLSVSATTTTGSINYWLAQNLDSTLIFQQDYTADGILSIPTGACVTMKSAGSSQFTFFGNPVLSNYSGIDVYDNANLTIENLILDGSKMPTANDQPFIYMTGNLYLKPGAVIKNMHTTASGDASVIIANAPTAPTKVILAGAIITNNTSAVSNGVIRVGSNVTLDIYDGSVISNNTSSADGLLVVACTTLNIYGGDFYGNKTSGRGGFIRLTNSSCSNATVLNMFGGDIHDNLAGNGGGVYVGTGSDFNMSGGKIRLNTATNGGGVFSQGNSVVINPGAQISGNGATSGGGIYLSSGSLTVLSSVTGNTASDTGGSVYVTGSSSLATFGNASNKAEISNNTGQNGGGGILASAGRVVLKNIHMTGNKNSGASDNGSAIRLVNAVLEIGALVNIGDNDSDNGIYLSEDGTRLTIIEDLASSSRLNIARTNNGGAGFVVARKFNGSGGAAKSATNQEAANFFAQTAVKAYGTNIGIVVNPSTNQYIVGPVDEYLSFQAGPYVQINAVPGTFSSNKQTVKIDANYYKGYSLSVSSSTSDNSLKTAGGQSIPALSSTFNINSPTTISGAQSVWGFRVNGIGAFGSTTTTESAVTQSAYTWSSLTSGTGQIIRSTSLPDPGNTYNLDVWFGAGVTHSQPAGTYTTTIVYTLVSNS